MKRDKGSIADKVKDAPKSDSQKDKSKDYPSGHDYFGQSSHEEGLQPLKTEKRFECDIPIMGATGYNYVGQSSYEDGLKPIGENDILEEF